MDSHEPKPATGEPAAAEAQASEYEGPFSERGTRILKFAVVFMGILLIVGFMVVVITIAYRAVKLGQKADNPPAQVVETQGAVTEFDLAIPSGSSVSRIELDGNRMAVHVTGGTRNEILIVDVASGKLVGRVKLQQQGE